MARPVIGNQLSVIRTGLLFLLVPMPVFGKDFGIHGVVAQIEEESPLLTIQNKLKGLQESGELAQHQKKLMARTKQAVERPQPVPGITRATKMRTWNVDPSYTVPWDIADHEGRVFAKKGDRINPLEMIALDQTILFFDGDDEDQKVWVQKQIKLSGDKSPTLILIKGAPLKLAEEWNQSVYFDQWGRISKQLQIKHVPARVIQEGLWLKIEEIVIEEETP